MDNALMTLSALQGNSKPAKLGFKRYSNVPTTYTAAVARRNERERNRVRQVNNGFVVLRQRIPFAKANKKMSKVETLRCAVDYIRQLQQLLTVTDQTQFSSDISPSVSDSSMVSLNGATSPSCSPLASSFCNSPSLTSPGQFASSMTGMETADGDSPQGSFYRSYSPMSSHSLDNTSCEVTPSTFCNSDFAQHPSAPNTETWFGYY